MRIAAALAAALLGLASPAAADVVSKAPDSAEVVIYRDRPVRTAESSLPSRSSISLIFFSNALKS